MDSITFIRNFDVSKVEYGEPKLLDSGMKAVPMTCNNAPIIIQTPQCFLPYGINSYTNDANMVESYEVNMSFKDMNERDTLKMFYDKMTELDKKNISQALKNSQQYLRMKTTTPDVIDALYTRVVKHPKDKNTGEIIDKYPPTFKIKMPSKAGKLTCQVYDENKLLVENVNDLHTKGAKVIAIIQCSGLWIISGKIGCSWKLVQMQIFTNPKITGFAIKMDEDDMLLESSEDEDENE